ncbi:MAG: hypothetical protein KAS32_12410 [Candidatus Peribacteraceae bacterium]|nr:hypothetical protein [Candidatus Peribacteraceae bacterium]
MSIATAMLAPTHFINNQERMKHLIFKLLFKKEIENYLSSCIRREKQYKYLGKKEVSGYIATSNCRMDFVVLFLNNK